MPVTIVLAIVGFASAISYRNADPILALVASDFGINVAAAALLVTAYTLPYSLMQLALGPVGDAIGKARLIKICVVVLAAALLASALAPSYASLMGARIVAGGFAGGLIPVAMALIGDRIAFERRQLAISRLLTATLTGQLVGAASAGLLADVTGWRGVFGFAAVVTGIASLFGLAFLKASGQPRKPISLTAAAANYAEVLRNPRSRAVYLLVMCEGGAVFGAFPFIVVLLELHGRGGAVQAGLVITSFAVGGLAYTGLVRLFLRSLGQRRMIALGGIIGGLSLAAAGMPMPWTLMAALFFGLGLGFFMVHNSLQTEASELAPDARTSAFALFACLYFLGQAVGVAVVREISELAGLPNVMLGLGVIFMAIGVLAAWRLGRP